MHCITLLSARWSVTPPSCGVASRASSAVAACASLFLSSSSSSIGDDASAPPAHSASTGAPRLSLANERPRSCSARSAHGPTTAWKPRPSSSSPHAPPRTGVRATAVPPSSASYRWPRHFFTAASTAASTSSTSPRTSHSASSHSAARSSSGMAIGASIAAAHGDGFSSVGTKPS